MIGPWARHAGSQEPTNDRVQIVGIVHYARARALEAATRRIELGEDLPSLETLQAFFDTRGGESLALRDGLTAKEIDPKLLAVHRPPFSAIRKELATDEGTSQD